jgi:hypothetical protein
VAEGVRYSRTQHGYEVNPAVLKEKADLTLETIKKDKKRRFPEVRAEVLKDIRNAERRIYSDVLGKMFGGRSAVHRQAAQHRKVW